MKSKTKERKKERKWEYIKGKDIRWLKPKKERKKERKTITKMAETKSKD